MNTQYFTVTWLPVWSQLPQVANMPAPAKPAKTTSSEVLDPTRVLSAEQVKSVLMDAIVGTDLFAEAALNPAMVAAIPADWIYAYYLNARYGRAMPVSMMPLRVQHVYNENDYLLPPLLLCSAILMRLWDETKSTINPTIKHENDCLMRCIVQLNYVIYGIVKRNPTGQKPNLLLVSSIQAYDSNAQETEIYYWFDADRLIQWESQGRTAEEAIEWWQTHQTQPS